MFLYSFAGEIGVQQTETSDVERSIKHMQNDMLKLNMLLHKERGMELDLNQGNALLESDFIGSLKVCTSYIGISHRFTYMFMYSLKMAS